MFRIAHAGVLAAALAAMGCQHLPTVGQDDAGSAPATRPAGTRDAETRQLFSLLNYYERSSALDEETVHRRLAILESRLDPQRCSAARIRFAILLTRLPASAGAPGDGPLAPCTYNPHAGKTAEELLAPLLSDLMTARHTGAESRTEAQSLANKLADMQAENGKLRKQLEGLKAIEQSLQKRGTPEEE